jgi:hypothetical protein
MHAETDAMNEQQPNPNPSEGSTTFESVSHTADAPPPTSEATGEPQTEMLGNFPPEIATLLVIAGIAGVILPGPIGTPLLIAGGVVLWPKTFRPIEKWFSRKFPALHREGVIQLKEFVNDLNRRFPEEKGS